MGAFTSVELHDKLRDGIEEEALEEKKTKVPDEIQKASTPEIDICAGAVDGILIWTIKPTVDECNFLGVCQKKFLCDWKNKIGLNYQAVSDARGRFLDISIVYGGASSDCLTFERSNLFGQLNNGMLAEGLCLLGDNAYLNSPFMDIPYQNVSSGSRDDYNFYHSQLRIRVECAFVIFTERWAILRLHWSMPWPSCTIFALTFKKHSPVKCSNTI
ncbi:DDE superfamily endonuclease [Nitzschia inconspicua]|uniref:DDE superfamily endonuclease n=1 Tax=Nitzschia inconspicua TaxID=303405 RepID=A0A9K3PFZ9_9STRA|nr:DDE superfamily endonuclease [Nitzschia inconspicua]KAG7345850.1 DDE superfamily endonuclease [Nitzschia inconspicua]KAG7362341.1 DDE superfamily endonuclease [Nitzschia inconspicua]